MHLSMLIWDEAGQLLGIFLCQMPYPRDIIDGHKRTNPPPLQHTGPMQAEGLGGGDWGARAPQFLKKRNKLN